MLKVINKPHRVGYAIWLPNLIKYHYGLRKLKVNNSERIGRSLAIADKLLEHIVDDSITGFDGSETSIKEALRLSDEETEPLVQYSRGLLKSTTNYYLLPNAFGYKRSCLEYELRDKEHSRIELKYFADSMMPSTIYISKYPYNFHFSTEPELTLPGVADFARGPAVFQQIGKEFMVREVNTSLYGIIMNDIVVKPVGVFEFEDDTRFLFAYRGSRGIDYENILKGKKGTKH